MSRIKKYVLSLFILLLFSVILVLPVVWEDIKTELSIHNTLRGRAEVEARFEELLELITSIAGDTLLEEGKTGLQFDRFYPKCLCGNAHQLFGSDRAYAEILIQFDRVLTDMGWSNWLYDRNPPPAAVTVDRPTYNNPGWTVDLSIEQRNDFVELHPEWEQYQTVYEIGLVFAEPSVFECYG